MKKIFILLINILFITEVKAESLKYVNCGAFEMPMGLANVINITVNIMYLGVPFILILTGSFDFTKAVMAKDQKGIESFRPKFLNRLKSGTIVFLVFSLVKILVAVVSSNTSNDINQCLECLVNHNSCGGEVESPHKLETSEEGNVPDFKGPTLNLEAYEIDKNNVENPSGFTDHNGVPYHPAPLPPAGTEEETPDEEKDDEKKDEEKKDEEKKDDDKKDDKKDEEKKDDKKEEESFTDHNGVPYNSSVLPNN